MLVHCSKIELGPCIALIGGSTKPVQRRGIIPFNAFAVRVNAAEFDLRNGVALLRQGLVNSERGLMIALVESGVRFLKGACSGREILKREKEGRNDDSLYYGGHGNALGSVRRIF